MNRIDSFTIKINQPVEVPVTNPITITNGGYSDSPARAVIMLPWPQGDPDYAPDFAAEAQAVFTLFYNNLPSGTMSAISALFREKYY